MKSESMTGRTLCNLIAAWTVVDRKRLCVAVMLRDWSTHPRFKISCNFFRGRRFIGMYRQIREKANEETDPAGCYCVGGVRRKANGYRYGDAAVTTTSAVGPRG